MDEAKINDVVDLAHSDNDAGVISDNDAAPITPVILGSEFRNVPRGTREADDILLCCPFGGEEIQDLIEVAAKDLPESSRKCLWPNSRNSVNGHKPDTLSKGTKSEQITWGDIQRFGPGRWLNDSLINAMLNW